MYKIQGAESCGGSRKLSMYKHGEDGTASTIESLRFQPALQQCVPRGPLPMTHTNQMAVQMSPESLRSHIYRAGSIPCHAGVHEYQLGASWHRQMKVVVRPRGPVSRSNTVLHGEKKTTYTSSVRLVARTSTGSTSLEHIAYRVDGALHSS